MQKTDESNLRSLPIKQAVELMTKSGSKLASEEQFAADAEAGAPITDTTVDFIAYVAWLAKRHHG